MKTFVSAYIWFLLKNAKCYSERTQTVTRKTPITHISSNSYFRVWIISETTFNVLEKLLWLARPRTASHWWVWVACLKWHRNTLYHWLLWIHSVQLSKLSPFLVFYFLIWNLGIRHSSFSRLLGINVASRILCGIHQKVVLFFYFKFSHNSPSDPPLKDYASQATPLSDSSAQSKESSSLSKCTFPCPYLMFKVILWAFEICEALHWSIKGRWNHHLSPIPQFEDPISRIAPGLIQSIKGLPIWESKLILALGWDNHQIIRLSFR